MSLKSDLHKNIRESKQSQTAAGKGTEKARTAAKRRADGGMDSSSEEEVSNQEDLSDMEADKASEASDTEDKRKRKTINDENEKRRSESFGSVLGKILERAQKSGGEAIRGTRAEREARKEQRERKEQSRQRVQLLAKDRVVPSAPSDEHEKRLARIATKGVVRLFNAVSKQKKELQAGEDKPKKPEQAEKLSKKRFLELLQAGQSKES